MKIEFKKKLPIKIASRVASTLTCILAGLYIYNGSLLLRILTGECVCITMILHAVDSFVYKKQKVSKYLLGIVCRLSLFFLFVILFTICIGWLQ